jgi:hypothetical protein
VTWQRLRADISTEGPQRWGGITLLRDGVDAVRLDLAPTPLSTLRVVPTSTDPETGWSIAELSVFVDE